MEVYKVVKHIDGVVALRPELRVPGKLVSVFATHPAVVEYTPGVWVAVHSKLSELEYDICVFDNERSARRWMKTFIWPRSIQLWKCVGLEAHDPPKQLSLAVIKQCKSLGTLVKVLSRNEWTTIETWPDGTIMVKKLMLKERMM